ncbi:MAG: GNAT family N-acetyltransferase [Gemmataceae bacterium]
MDFSIAPFTAADWDQIRSIYLDGIATGNATFETEAPTWEQWDAAHRSDGRLAARAGDDLLGWAALSPVSRRRVYAGVAEVSLYVGASHRGHGIGTALLKALIAETERLGIWTLQGGTFPENSASLRLQTACGFRIIGRRERIGCLDSVWRDTVLTERRSAVVGVS